jgi:TolB-like protein
VNETLQRLTNALAGRYTIDRELGRGGMAVVYLARDERHQRMVAIKMMLPEVVGDLGTERFKREIQIAARLSHPNILPVFDSGEIENAFFYVMPFVEGESLAVAILRAKQLTIAEAVTITRQVASALDYAHAEGVVHRDIKPPNILLARPRPRSDGTIPDRTPIVTDFGIARALSAGGTRLTSTGLMVGTPTYMSPEQFSNEEIDGRSDQYSLACVLYEMLVGEPPFSGSSPMVVFARHASETVPSLRIVRSTIPEALEEVIFRAMSKVPADRYESIAAFSDAIDAAMAESGGTGRFSRAGAEIVTQSIPRRAVRSTGASRTGAGAPPTGAGASPTGTGAPPTDAELATGTYGKRSRIALAGAAIVVTLAAIGLGWRVLHPGAQDRLRLVVLPFANSGPVGDSSFADGLTEEVISRLSGVPRLGVVARTSAMKYKGTRASAKDIGRELNVQKIVQGTVVWKQATASARQVIVHVAIVNTADEIETPVSDFDGAKLDDIFSIASAVAAKLDLVTGLEANNRSRLAARPTQNREAYEAFLQGNRFYNHSWDSTDVKAAIISYENAVRLDPSFALALAALGRTHGWMYQLRIDDHPSRLVYAKQFIDSALRLSPDLPEAHMALGLYKYWGKRDYDGALQQFDLVQRALPSSADAFNAIGNVNRRKGAFTEAAAGYELAAQFDPRAHQTLFNQAEVLLYLRQYDKSERLVDRVIEIAPDFIDGPILKATLQIHRLGDPAAARRMLSELAARVSGPRWRAIGHHWRAGLFRIVDDSLASAERRLVVNTFGLDTAHYLIARGETYRRFGETARARTYFDSAATYMEATVRRHPDWSNAHGQLALAYAGLGRAADAVREANQAEDMLNETTDALDGPEWVVNVAEAYSMLGNVSKAMEWLAWAMRIPSRLSPKWIELDPIWAPLRSDPRFQTLIKQPPAFGAVGARPH